MGDRLDKLKILEETVRDLHKNETFEKALGRAIRRNGGTYSDYIDIIGDVRELARKRRITLVEAAKKLSEGQE